MTRKPISKRIRFEVFKRDSFTCQYCGNKPPGIILELDHLKPVSKKGTDNINNLITSCFNCNRGKSNIDLKLLPNSLKDNLEIIKEKEEQLKEYHKLIRKIENRLNKEIEIVSKRLQLYYPKKEFSDNFKITSIKRFLYNLQVNEVLEALDIACGRMKNIEKAIPYFCGICWNKIKGIKSPYEKD